MSTGDALALLAERVDFLASSLANETAARLQLEAASAAILLRSTSCGCISMES